MYTQVDGELGAYGRAEEGVAVVVGVGAIMELSPLHRFFNARWDHSEKKKKKKNSSDLTLPAISFHHRICDAQLNDLSLFMLQC